MAFPKLPIFLSNVRKPNMIAFGMFPTGTDLTCFDGTNAGGGGGVPFYTDFTPGINGSNVNFTLSGTPTDVNLVSLYWNGLRLTRGVNYNITGANITMVLAPQIGETLWAYFY
jgi:hypothetical protein